jgi:hypothetical protein
VPTQSPVGLFLPDVLSAEATLQQSSLIELSEGSLSISIVKILSFLGFKVFSRTLPVGETEVERADGRNSRESDRPVYPLLWRAILAPRLLRKGSWADHPHV